MTALSAARWTLLGSILFYGLGFVIGHELGLLIALIGNFAVAFSALACVVLQLVQYFKRKRRHS